MAARLPTPFSDPLRFGEAPRVGLSRRAWLLLRRAAYRLVTHVLPLMLAVITGAFLLIHAAPGTVVDIMTSEMQLSDQATIDKLNATYGLDQPLYVQFYKYLWSVAHLDLGFSYRQGMSVTDAVFQHLPATLLLMLAAMTVALVVGVLGGVVAARNSNGVVDRILAVFGVVLYAAPSFWVGLLLIVVFSVHLGWTPIGDMVSIGYDGGLLGNLLDLLHHLALPAIALGLHQSAIYLRVTRNAMLDMAHRDFVRTARAKGLGDGTVTWRHIFRNAMLPVVTVLGMQFAAVLSGSIIIETVFNWPGIGGLLYDSTVARDYPLVLGIIILGSLVVILVNLLVDLLYGWLDPRIGAA